MPNWLLAEPDTVLADLLSEHFRRATDGLQITIVRTCEELASVGAGTFDLTLVELVLEDADTVPWLRSRVAPPFQRIVVLTACEKDALIHAALQTGLPGIVHKADGLSFLQMAVQSVLAGGAVMSPRIHKTRARLFSDPHLFVKLLSEHEQRILSEVCSGRAVPEIARSLGIKASTVVDHRKNILRKLGLHSQAALVAYAIDKGFVRADVWTRAALPGAHLA